MAVTNWNRKYHNNFILFCLREKKLILLALFLEVFSVAVQQFGIGRSNSCVFCLCFLAVFNFYLRSGDAYVTSSYLGA